MRPEANTNQRSMDIYKNHLQEHKGYELQEPYQLYNKQDQFDSFHDKGGYRENPTQDYPPVQVSPKASNTYMD